MQKLLSTLTLAIFSMGVLWAQDIAVQGTVVSQTDQTPLPGVNVLVKGDSDGQIRGTVTDTDGKYTIRVPADGTLVFSFIGYESLEVAVNNQTNLQVSLVEDIQALSEVVVVGYGTVQKKDLTSAVSSVGEEDFIPGFNSSPEQMIQGKVPGVYVSSGDGTPGGAVRIRIRGTTSINSSNEPLYVVDGVPIGLGGSSANGVRETVVETNALSFLNPDDVESIDILKGPSAAAIYGSRAANGVVLITTKSGKTGKGTLTLDSKVGMAAPFNFPDVLTADEYRQALSRFGQSIVDGGADTNWYDEVTRSALVQSYSLSYGGGSESSSYYGSFGYIGEEGAMINNQMQKIMGRVNFEQKAIDDRLTVGMNINVSSNNYDNGQVTPNNGGGSRPGNLGMAIRFNPTQPVYNPDGTYNELEFPSREVWNPVAMSEQMIDELHEEILISNLQADFKIFDFLSYNINLGYTNRNTERNIFWPSTSQAGAQTNGRAIKRTTRNYSELLENTLRFDKDFGPNNLNAIVGYSWQEFTNEYLEGENTNFLFDQTTYNNLQGGGTDSRVLSSGKSQNRLISFFGRVNYSYHDKFLLTFALRSDGSTRFGENNKWALFPSAAVAWRVSEEAFMANSSVFDDFKLRFEYGELGNEGIGNYQSQETVQPTGDAYNMGNGNFLPAVKPTQFANPDLKWETTKTFNVGVDFGFFDSRLTGTLDYYIRTTEDLLLEFDVPSPCVVCEVTDNVGEMKNTGFELGLSWAAIRNPDGFSLDIQGNFAINNNEVVDLSNALFGTDEINYFSLIGPGFVGDNAFKIKPGDPIHSIYAFDFVRIDENGEEVFLDEEGNETTVSGNPAVKNFGSALPTLNYSLTPTARFRNWDLSVYIRGASGHKLINNTTMSLGQPSWLGTGYNIIASGIDDPNVTTGTTHEFSDRFIEDGAFVKIDNITLGYNLNTNSISWLSSARVYFAGRNLVTITDYTGADPEVFNYARGAGEIPTFGVDYLPYPRSRQFTFGVRASF